MKLFSKFIKDIFITVAFLIGAYVVSLLFQYIFNVQEHVTTVFVFAVFLISLLTNGYLYGVFSAFVGTLAVNYAFTFPYFRIDFAIPVNLISGVVMIGISVLTSALTTKLKHHEAIKIESEKERLRANLLRAVSHDIRTPLTTIYGSSTTLLENGSAMTDEQKEKIVLGIKEDSEWLMRIVENLLSITKINGGQVELIKTPTVLEEVVDSVMLKFRKRYPTQKVEIEIPDDIIVVPMDAILIEQVLINILENAVQHATGMTNLIFRVYTHKQCAVFEIEDNGCGINAQKIETLFNGSYVPENEGTDSKKKNAGIGLSVCSSIIKAHGGHIRVKNSKTGGAIFCFALEKEEINYDTE